MIIKSIRIKEGLFSRTIKFSDNVNLIHSVQNSKGKTTLLRFLLYSLGYNIPNTKKIKFERCEVETVLYSEKTGDITLSRKSNVDIDVFVNKKQLAYVLPEQQLELQGVIWGTDNIDILENLLGAFYVDQEKGWTLLNRGVVIGSIHFNIEALIRGLSGRDCKALIQQEARLSRELEKYKQMFSVARYQESIESEGGALATTDYNERVDFEIGELQIRKQSLNREYQRISKEVTDNTHFCKYIAEMKLLVKGPDGTEIPVKAENIVGFNDSVEYLKTKKKMVAAELSAVIKKINDLERVLIYEDEQSAFWETETMLQAFDRKIAALKVNAISIQKEIKRLTSELRRVRRKITERTRANNDVVNSLHRNVLKYAVELGIGSNNTIAASYLFTSNLKELSGALLHKTVFAFRLAYLIEIEKVIGIKLPIILDSPSGKEVDQENIKIMTNILKRDFFDHQIIIASIFEYDFNSPNIIELTNRVVER